MRLGGLESSSGDLIAILEATIEAAGRGCPSRDEIAEGVLAMGANHAAVVCHRLISTCFAAPGKSSRKSDERPAETLPFSEMVGAAVSMWGLSAAEAWAMTPPEWHAAADAFRAAHSTGREKDELTPEQEEDFLLDLRREKRAEKRRTEETLKRDAERDRVRAGGAGEAPREGHAEGAA